MLPANEESGSAGLGSGRPPLNAPRGESSPAVGRPASRARSTKPRRRGNSGAAHPPSRRKSAWGRRRGGDRPRPDSRHPRRGHEARGGRDHGQHRRVMAELKPQLTGRAARARRGALRACRDQAQPLRERPPERLRPRVPDADRERGEAGVSRAPHAAAYPAGQLGEDGPSTVVRRTGSPRRRLRGSEAHRDTRRKRYLRPRRRRPELDGALDQPGHSVRGDPCDEGRALLEHPAHARRDLRATERTDRSDVTRECFRFPMGVPRGAEEAGEALRVLARLPAIRPVRAVLPLPPLGGDAAGAQGTMPVRAVRAVEAGAASGALHRGGLAGSAEAPAGVRIGLRVGMWFRARWEEDQNALGPARERASGWNGCWPSRGGSTGLATII